MAQLWQKLTQKKRETAVHQLNQLITSFDQKSTIPVGQALRWSAVAISFYAMSGGDLSLMETTAPFLASLVSAIGGDVVANFIEKLADDDKTPQQIEQLLQAMLNQSQQLNKLLGQLPTQAELYKAINYLEHQNQQRHETLLNTLLPFLRRFLEISPTQFIPTPSPLNILPPHTPLPPNSRMLYPRLPHFRGRQSELLAIAQSFWGDEADRSVVITATGLGGIGKSSLAIEFAHRYGRFFPGGVFWLNFAEANDIGREVAACAPYLGLPPGLSQLEQVTAVQRAWQQPEARLLIFDNCDGDDAEEILAQWRPVSGGCHILVTSRRGQWDAALGVQLLPLDVLSRAESVRLLLHLTGGDSANLIWDKLAEELGDLPLALYLSGRFLHTYRDINPKVYLQQLQDGNLLSHPALTGHGVRVSATGREMHVGRVFALSYDRLQSDSPKDAIARDLLGRSACLAPGESIPRSLLWATLANGGQVPQPLPLEWMDGLLRLDSLGLLTEDQDGNLKLHRLLAAFVADVYGTLPQTAVELAVVRLAIEQHDKGHHRHLAAWQHHIRHVVEGMTHPVSRQSLYAYQKDNKRIVVDATAVKNHMKRLHRLVTLCKILGTHLTTMGDYVGAKLYCERALMICEKELKNPHQQADILGWLGAIFREQKDYATARPFYEQALAIKVQLLGVDHPGTVGELIHLGLLLKQQGDLAGARRLYERALSIAERVDHPATAVLLVNLGTLLATQGDLAQARSLLERALAIEEQAGKSKHVAAILTNLGHVLEKQEDFAAARSLFARVLDLNEQKLGDAPATAVAIKDLGSVLERQGDLAEATALFEKAITIEERLLKSADVGISASARLGQLSYAQGNYVAAQKHLEQALAQAEQKVGKDHPHVATILNNLGSSVQKQGDLASAQQFYRQALSIFEHATEGLAHPHAIPVLENLADLLKDQKDYAGSQHWWEQILAIKELQVEADPLGIARALSNLGYLLEKQGNLLAAQPLYERELTIKESVLGKDHPSVAESLNILATLFHNQGKLTEAQPLFERALGIRQRVLGPSHQETASSLNNLALLLQDQGNLIAARSLYERVLNILEQVLGANHRDTIITLNNLVSLLEAQEDYVGALAVRERLLGADHPDTARSLHKLGSLLHAKGDYAGARPYWERALDIRQRTLEADDPDLASSLNSLGSLLHSQGELTQARPYLEQALDIFERVLGVNHHSTVIALNNLVSLLEAQEDYVGALAVRERLLGADHPDTVRSLHKVGSLLHGQGDYAGAKSCFAKALDSNLRIRGDEHTETAISFWWMAIILQKEGNLLDARGCFQQALTVFGQNLGYEHPHSVSVQHSLSTLESIIQ